MENNQRNSRKRLNSLILLVAFTAVMLIVSTYAWFSTQKNVTLNGLYGKVEVAEGLQISLDAEHWVNTINFNDFVQTTPGAWTVSPSATTTYLGDSSYTFQSPRGAEGGITNITPTDYVPVSTTGSGATNDGIGQSVLQMYNGTNTETVKLAVGERAVNKAADPSNEGTYIDTETNSLGYFAFDVFVMNTSKEEVKSDALLLDPSADVTGVNEDTGIQNTVRVAFALYENNNAAADFDPDDAVAGTDMTISGSNTLTADNIIAGTSTGKKIKDVAIWEPNANEHVSAIVSNLGKRITFSAADLDSYGLVPDAEEDAIYAWTNGKKLPTYALTSGSLSQNYTNIYNWGTTPATGLKKQYMLSTDAITTTVTTPEDGGEPVSTTVGTRSESVELLSIAEMEAPTGKEEDGTTTNDTYFDVMANQYQKMRIYVWIEGQDPDCINHASLGGGLTLNLGFSKEGTANT